MKVLMIGPSIKKSKGGMATVIKDILEDKSAFENIVIHHHASYADGNKVYILAYSLFSFIYFFLFCRSYDVYHLHMASKGSTYRKLIYVKLIKKWNKKIIIHIHGGGFVDFFNELDDKRKNSIKNIINKVDAVIALSREWKEKYIETLGLTNCIVIENAIDTCLYKHAVCDNQKFLSNFLLLGRMTKNKGTYDLINAVSIVKNDYPQIKVYLAGDGEIEKTQHMVRTLKLMSNVEVVGWVDKNEKIEIMKKVGTIVLPSYHEALPMSILEGMAAGKVIIATSVGAIPEVVNEENGFIITPGDIDELVELLKHIMSGMCDVNKIAKNNIEKSEKQYSIKMMHKKISNCYYEVNKK